MFCVACYLVSDAFLLPKAFAKLLLMNSRILTVAILAALAGSIGGFLLANGLNRSTLNALKIQLEKRTADPAGKTGASANPNDLNVSPDDIKSKIAEADANPTDLTFQKSLGRGLYRFATVKKDTELLQEAKRLLIRANSIDPKDYEILVDLGNAHFDNGYFKKDSASFKLARETYEKALALKPNDADVVTDFALSFYVDEPSDLKRAVLEFQKALTINPKQERALQFLTSTYIRESDFVAAQKTLDQLKASNPKNTAIPDLTTQIETRTYTPQP